MVTNGQSGPEFDKKTLLCLFKEVKCLPAVFPNLMIAGVLRSQEELTRELTQKMDQNQSTFVSSQKDLEEEKKVGNK